MDNTLLEATTTGNISLFRRLLEQNPLILADVTLFSSYGRLMHIAVKAGQANIVREILTRKPELATEVDQDGFRPLDIAAALGYVEIVGELVKSKVPGISQLKGRDGRAALHYAALYGRIEVIDELLTAYPESIKDVTILNETVLHLAVKNYQIQAFKRLVWWLQHLGFGELVNWSDRDGNTVLHLAVIQRQLEAIEFLLVSSNSSNTIIALAVQLSNINSKGLTPMDLVHMLPQNPIDDIPLHITKVLSSAGALRAQENVNNTATTTTTTLPQVTTNNNQQQRDHGKELKEDLFKFVSYQPNRDPPSDIRNALLVVATLIAAVTFQAGLSPPSKFVGTITNTLFFVANTLGCTSAITIIEYLSSGFPFQREVRISIWSLMFAYGLGIGTNVHGLLSTLFAVLSLSVPYLSRAIPRWIGKAKNLRNRPSSSTSQQADLQLTAA